MSEKWHQSEIRIVINDRSQGSIASMSGMVRLLYYAFIIQSAGEYDSVTNFPVSLTMKEF